VIGYIDSSVLLRMVLGEKGALDNLAFARRAVSSRLIEAESLRTLDRLRFLRQVDPAELASRQALLLDWLREIDLAPIDEDILRRVGRPLPVALGTLDAIHLATAERLLETEGAPLTLATHDTQLALAARALGLTVIGV
jgi:predicted nucleic acid-binding protein